MSAHTNELWRAVRINGTSPDYSIVSGAGGNIATCFYEKYARRIVACVNACTGVSTEQLERSLTDPHFSAGREITAERDAARDRLSLLQPACAGLDDKYLKRAIEHGGIKAAMSAASQKIFDLEADLAGARRERDAARAQVAALTAAFADIEGTTVDPRAMKKAEDAL